MVPSGDGSSLTYGVAHPGQRCERMEEQEYDRAVILLKIAGSWRKAEELPGEFMESHCRAEQRKVQTPTSELLC